MAYKKENHGGKNRIIKKGDNVIVITGKWKGRQGKVLKIDAEKDRAVVEGVNIAQCHIRPSEKNPSGGRVEKAMPIHMSNLSLVCPKTEKATRIRVERREVDGKTLPVRLSVKGEGAEV